ncbi:hypothetical protein QWY31_00365 [Cytophagales bacterium LB-30]|uniref:Molecular chaperone DnaJ n=1 Tax=Shiella aurantiaca TaxID=3058365 RepID=A0ABT8F0L3_9BACT|nr:hypothetical protein [Shiella aurantiaca]MDN4163928.1 hypothetical protein [Shiella aurantiaca]
MSKKILVHSASNEEAIAQWKATAERLEKEWKEIEAQCAQFEAHIRNELQQEIKEIHRLTLLYKEQKKAKKLKRLEQKKRGKNYKEPQGIQPLSEKNEKPLPTENPDLKKLYKETIRHVHPDTQAQDEESQEAAHALTLELMKLYKASDFQRMLQFHEYILSGKGLPAQIRTEVSTYTGVGYWQQKIKDLEEAIAAEKQRFSYGILTSYPDPMTFIPELREQLKARIQVLKKRTRT